MPSYREEIPSSDESLSSREGSSDESNTTTGLDWGLSADEKANFLRVIDAAGGIPHVAKNLAKLLSADQKFFGSKHTAQGKKRRKQFTNCFNKWQAKLKEGKFEEERRRILQEAGLFQAAASPQSQPSNKKTAQAPKRSPKQPPQQETKSSKMSEKKKPDTPPPETVVLHKYPWMNKYFIQVTRTNGHRLTSKGPVVDFIKVALPLHDPSMYTDGEDIFITAALTEERDGIIVQMPSMTTAFRNHPRRIHQLEEDEEEGFFDEQAYTEHEVAATYYHNNEDVQKKTLLLLFPQRKSCS